MSSFEIGALMVLGFSCWAASNILVLWYEAKWDRHTKSNEMRRFSGESAKTRTFDTDEPVAESLPPKEVKIESSFEDKRIGRLP